MMTSGDMKFLVKRDDPAIYAMKPAEKVYMKIVIPDGDSPAGEAAAAAQQMMGNVDVKVTPTEETKDVGEWSTRKFDISMKFAMGEIKMASWATEEIKLDRSLFNRVTNAMTAQMPGMQKIADAMDEVEGVPVAG